MVWSVYWKEQRKSFWPGEMIPEDSFRVNCGITRNNNARDLHRFETYSMLSEYIWYMICFCLTYCGAGERYRTIEFCVLLIKNYTLDVVLRSKN